MAHEPKRGFVSGSALACLFVCLFVTLNLGRALAMAALEVKQNAQGIRAGLCLEENLIRLDQGKAFVPFSEGPYRLRLLEEGSALRLQLLDEGEIKEDVWLNDAASY